MSKFNIDVGDKKEVNRIKLLKKKFRPAYCKGKANNHLSLQKIALRHSEWMDQPRCRKTSKRPSPTSSLLAFLRENPPSYIVPHYKL